MAIETFNVREFQEGESTAILRNISAPILRKVEPVGTFYERFCKTGRVRSTSVPPTTGSVVEDDQVEEDLGSEEVSLTIPNFDPKNWKDQDHYEILGLGALRLQATEEQIKRAHKRMVLRYHPDKRRALGLPVQSGEEAYFACITKAYEILSNTKRRQAFDSVDPSFDDSIPSLVKDATKFYSSFRPVFQRNARWSINKPVPELGDESSTFEEVNDFYSFWLDFESWREFSYLDEEDKTKGENRDERRWIEKQNKAERQKRRKEEVARIRELVDNAYASDPRIVKFKEEERQKKLAVKQAKQEAIAKVKAEENEKKRQQQLEEERKQQKKEEEEKAQAAAIKKEKEEQKKVAKKERKKFRTVMKEFNYFSTNEAESISRLEESDKLAEFLSIEKLQNLNSALTSGNRDEALKAFSAEVSLMNAELDAERSKDAATSQKRSGQGGDKEKTGGGWTEEEMQLLVKAVNLFPAGTVSRWETVAAFINQHNPNKQRSAKDVLAQAKSFQKMEVDQKESANKQAFDRMNKTQKSGATVESLDISERYMSVGEQQAGELGSNPAPWTAKEQKVLEQAMRTHGADVPDRWDKIAEMIPTRTKKDCMKRYKELCDIVRAKKLAQATAAGK